MSIVKTHSVFCDVNGSNCHGWIAQVTDGQGGSAAARREAKAAGWVRRDGLDCCPGCKASHDKLLAS